MTMLGVSWSENENFGGREKRRGHGPGNAASVGPVQMVSRQHPAAKMSNGNSKSVIIVHANVNIAIVLEMDP